MHGVKAALAVCIHDQVIICFTDLTDKLISRDTGIIDQDVNMSVFFKQILNHTADGRKVSNITTIALGMSAVCNNLLHDSFCLIFCTVIIDDHVSSIEASFTATARPIPCSAPVTSATLLFNITVVLSFLFCICQIILVYIGTPAFKYDFIPSFLFR